MDDIGLKLCNIQAQLFERSSEHYKCSSVFFIEKYMKSSLATRLDNKNFIFEANDILSCYSELNINEKYINKHQIKYPGYLISWIGYFYRYASYEYNITSKRIYNIIKPDELYLLYESYHSLDIDEAIKRVFESKNISISNINFSLSLANKIYFNN